MTSLSHLPVSVLQFLRERGFDPGLPPHVDQYTGAMHQRPDCADLKPTATVDPCALLGPGGSAWFGPGTLRPCDRCAGGALDNRLFALNDLYRCVHTVEQRLRAATAALAGPVTRPAEAAAALAALRSILDERAHPHARPGLVAVAATVPADLADQLTGRLPGWQARAAELLAAHPASRAGGGAHWVLVVNLPGHLCGTGGMVIDLALVEVLAVAEVAAWVHFGASEPTSALTRVPARLVARVGRTMSLHDLGPVEDDDPALPGTFAHLLDGSDLFPDQALRAARDVLTPVG